MAEQSLAPNRNKEFLVGLARAFAGAVLFSVPLMMTMEMWWLGFYIKELRLVLLLVLLVPCLVILSYFIGFEENPNLMEDVLDGLSAFAVGCISAAVMLALFSVIGGNMSLNEIVGKITLLAVPGSIGALLAQSQFGVEEREMERKRRNASFLGGLFIMGTGAMFLALQVAPTEEMILITYMMTPWQVLVLAIFCLVIMHAFVYVVKFKGQPALPEGVSFWSIFFRHSVVGSSISLLLSFYLLWTFGRTDGMSISQIISATVVLGFPASLGAAAARLIL